MDELVRIAAAGREDNKGAWGRLEQRAPESALVRVGSEFPTWYPWRNVLVCERVEVNEDGSRTLHYADGAFIVEGTTTVPGVS